MWNVNDFTLASCLELRNLFGYGWFLAFGIFYAVQKSL